MRNGKRLPLPAFAVEALREMPGYGTSEYLFPARPNVRHKDVEKFSKPYAWELGERFVCANAGVSDLRIHDLRHFATASLFMGEIPDTIIRKMTSHRSEELERYKHLSPSFRQQSVELIGGKISRQIATFSATPVKKAVRNTKDQPGGWSNMPFSRG